MAGKDKLVLDKFQEPAWNNPVVRFLDTTEKDVIPRKNGVYTAAELLSRMGEALKKSERPLPEYLKLVNAEYNPGRREAAAFAMECFWEGEKHLGAIEGILHTRVGSLEGHEVVELEFDPTVLTYEKLVEEALKLKCTSKIFARTDEQLTAAKRLAGNRAVRSNRAAVRDKEQQHSLSLNPLYFYLPLTALQATKVNAVLADEESPDRFLSPGQLVLRQRIAEVWAKDRKRFAKLKPERSSDGVTKYAEQLNSVLAK